MPFEEKFTWVSAVVSSGVAAVYFAGVLGQLRTVPVAEIAYQRPLLIAIGALIALTILGTIVVAIGSAISARITGKGSSAISSEGRAGRRHQPAGRAHRLLRSSPGAARCAGSCHAPATPSG